MSFIPGYRLVDGTDLNSIGTANFPMSDVFLTGLFNESAQDSITAHAGGTKAAAFQLTKEMNRISVAATAGDSVLLPASAPGLTIIVENAGAAAVQVYGLGTDTINAVATATGVSQMAGSVVFYTCYAAGAWFANGLGTGYSGSFETASLLSGITAFATGGQASATAMTAMINVISTCATTGDSVKLPVAATGLVITVVNNGAASANIFPVTGSFMNAVSNASVACAAGTVLILYAIDATHWISK